MSQDGCFSPRRDVPNTHHTIRTGAGERFAIRTETGAQNIMTDTETPVQGGFLSPGGDIPQMYRPVIGTDTRQRFAIRTEHYAVQQETRTKRSKSGVSGNREFREPRCDVPLMHDSIFVTETGERFVIAPETYASDTTNMPAEDGYLFPAVDIPQARRSICPAAGERPAIRTETQAHDIIGTGIRMSCETVFSVCVATSHRYILPSSAPAASVLPSALKLVQ